MSDVWMRARATAAAGIAIGGFVALLLPQHVRSIAAVVLATGAVAAALAALGRCAPVAWWRSPFDAATTSNHRNHEIDWIAKSLYGWRQRVGPDALPPAVLRSLRPLVQLAVERGRLDNARLSPLTRALLLPATGERIRWLRLLPPNPRRVAASVRTVLDDLDYR